MVVVDVFLEGFALDCGVVAKRTFVRPLAGVTHLVAPQRVVIARLVLVANVAAENQKKI